MSQPECPFARTSVESRLPKTLQEYMKKYLIIRPRLDPRYFVFDTENQIDYDDKSSDIVPAQNSQDSGLLSPLLEPPPSPRRTFSSEILGGARGMRLDASTEQRSGEKDTSELDSDSESGSEAKTPPQTPCTPIGAVKSESSFSSSISDGESSSPNSTATDIQTVDKAASMEEDQPGLVTRRLRDRRVHISNIANTKQFGNNNKRKRVRKREKSKFDTKRIKKLDIQTDQVKSPSKTLPIKGRMASSPVIQTPLPHTNQWTVHEMECLVSAMKRYPNKWNAIHGALDFHPRRSLQAIRNKVLVMKRNGDLRKYSRRIREKSGYNTSVDGRDDFDNAPTETNGMITSLQPSASLCSPTNSTPIQSPKVHNTRSPMVMTPVYKTPLMKPWTSWTVHEMECLVSAVMQYGNRWKVIHRNLDFQPRRTLGGIKTKFKLMIKNGDFKKYSKKIKEKAGHKAVADDRADTPTEPNEMMTSPRNTSTPNRIRKSPEVHNTRSPTVKSPVFKTPLMKPWTDHEMECLVVGVNRYGNKWKTIHDAFNFHPSRSLKALRAKFILMSKNGDFEKFLTNFRKKAGYKDLTVDADDAPTLDDLRLDSSKLAHKSVKKESFGSRKRWKKSEIHNLKKGFQKFGPRWDLIKKKYKFKRSEKSIKTHYDYFFNKSSKTTKSKDLEDKGSSKTKRKRTKISKKRVKWSREELEYLEEGVKKFGPKWVTILDSYDFNELMDRETLRRAYRQNYLGYARMEQTDNTPPQCGESSSLKEATSSEQDSDYSPIIKS